MHILFLGTGAADWNIAQKAESRKTRGEFRRFSSTLIDRTLLVDPGPHIFDFAEEYGDPHLYEGVTTVLITHSHADHFSGETVMALSKATGCTFFGDRACLEKLRSQGFDTEGLDFRPIGAFDTFSHADYTIISYHSNHGTENPNEQTRNYTIISPDGKKLFYGLDSGPFRYESWTRLRGTGFDGMILECTTGDLLGDDRIFGHSSLPWVLYSLETIKKGGTLKAGGKVFIDHMARTLHEPQEALERRLLESRSGIIAAYDGMEAEL